MFSYPLLTPQKFEYPIVSPSSPCDGFKISACRRCRSHVPLLSFSLMLTSRVHGHTGHIFLTVNPRHLVRLWNTSHSEGIYLPSELLGSRLGHPCVSQRGLKWEMKGKYSEFTIFRGWLCPLRNSLSTHLNPCMNALISGLERSRRFINGDNNKVVRRSSARAAPSSQNGPFWFTPSWRGPPLLLVLIWIDPLSREHARDMAATPWPLRPGVPMPELRN